MRDWPEKQEAPQPEETQRPAEPQQTEPQSEVTEGPQKSEEPQQETFQQDKPQLLSQCELMPQQAFAPVEHCSLTLPHAGQQGSAQVPGQGDVSSGKLTECLKPHRWHTERQLHQLKGNPLGCHDTSQLF